VALLALDELLEADLVRPTAAPRRFRFRHPIVRRTVYETIPGGSRLGAHARAASALAATGGLLVARAHHVERSAAAGDVTAIALLEEAADSVAPRAPLTAGRWLAAAVRLLPACAARERRLALLIKASATLAQAGASEEALTFVEQALPLLEPGEKQQRAKLVVQIAAAKRQTGHPLESRGVLEDALSSLDDPAGAESLTLRGELVLVAYFEGDFARMEELGRALSAAAQARANAPLAGLAAALVSVAATSRGHVADGRAAADEARRAFDTLNDEQLAASLELCGWLGLAATWLERGDAALACTRRGLAIARATGQGAAVPGLLGLEAQALLMKGRAGDALQVAETAADAARLSGNQQLLVWALQTSATASTWAGALDRAVFSAREAVALAHHVQEGFLAPLAHVVLAGALLAAGDAAGAR
jgi:tetratricopeptide (TPR) repeat protein